MNRKEKTKSLFTLVLMAMTLISPLFAEDTFKVPAPKESIVKINMQDVIEPVNRRVMGICLLYPPFDSDLAKLFENVFDGSSARAWNIDNYKEGTSSIAFWESFAHFVRDVNIEELNVMNPSCHINRPAHYLSENDNNLDPDKLPTFFAKQITMLKSSHEGFPNGFPITGWEIWNEPHAPKNGEWSPDAFARYVIDCSRAIKTAAPDIEVGAALSDGDPEWTRKLLIEIARKDPKAIDFLVMHPYWHHIDKTPKYGSYYSRVSASVPLAETFVRPRVRIINEIGHGRWRLVASEWNIHPPSYGPPYDVSTDMAVAINVAAMFGVFWEEGVDSAQYFELLGNQPDGEPLVTEGGGHFHLLNKTPSGYVFNSTGEVFRLYGRYFRGDRVRVKLDTPTYTFSPYWPPNTVFDIPILIAHAAYDFNNERIVLILTNRHMESDAPVQVDISNFKLNKKIATRKVVTAKGPESTEPILTTEDFMLNMGDNKTCKIEIKLPPYSVTALLIDGEVLK